MSADEFSMEFPKTKLQDSVKGDRRTQLEAIRDYIAHELEVHLCKTCLASRLRTGDQASLILRLQTVLAEIDALPINTGEVSELDRLRLRAVPGGHGSPDSEDQPLSGKSAQRRASSHRAFRYGRTPPGSMGAAGSGSDAGPA